MGYSEPSNCFIRDLVTGEQYDFQFMPESLIDSKQASFTDYIILGRSSPLKGYQYGPSRTMEVTLLLFAAPTMGNDAPQPADVNDKKNFLISLMYPDYDGGIKPPHKCLIQVGDGYAMVGVCTNASASPMEKTPWEDPPGYPHGQKVSVRFEEVKDYPLGVADRRTGSY